jgi:hypothetical protein
MRADRDGCGRGVAVALAVDEHAGGYVEGLGVGEDLVVVAVSCVACAENLIRPGGSSYSVSAEAA